MTQPVLFAVTDGEHSEVTEGGTVVPPSNVDRCDEKAEERKRGDIAEYLCAIELTRRGYTCNVMGSGCKGFDVIADRSDIRPQFVQVKHGFYSERGYYSIFNNKAGRLYGANAYDFLAFYMWDREQWVIYSRAELGNRLVTSYTPPETRQRARKSTTGIADRQPNNWELFDQLAMANSQESVGVTQQMSDPPCTFDQ